jgi:hypothetical protein
MVEKRSQKMTEYPSIGAFRWMDYFGTLKLYDEGCLEVCCLVTGVGKKCLAVSVSLASLELGGCLLAVHLNGPLRFKRKLGIITYCVGR